MNVTDVLSMSWTNLDRRKGRTALTCAGVVIGVAALVLMVSLGLGIELALKRMLGGEHSLRTISVNRMKAAGKKKRRTSIPGLGQGFAPLFEKDIAEMEKIPGVTLAQPYLYLWVSVTVVRAKKDTGSSYFEVGGIDPREKEAYREYLVAGDLWESDDRGCIVPLALLQSIFGELEPAKFIGRKITFSNPMKPPEGEDRKELTYAISGVFNSSKLSMLYGRRVFLPMDRAKDVRRRTGGGLTPLFFSEGSYLGAEVRAENVQVASDVASRLEKAGYKATSIGDILEVVNIIFLIFEGFLACVGAIGLIVSLFGIANTMAMAVLERTREIGIMKALGARNRDIGWVFLCEAGALGALGGIVGLALAIGTGFVLNAVARGLFEFGDEVGLFHVPLWLAVGSVLFSMFVSVLAGSLPARRAARMEPVAALRYE